MKTIKTLLLLIYFTGFVSLLKAQEKSKPSFSVSIGLGYFDSLSSNSDYGSVSFIDEPSKKPNINLNGDLALEIDKYIFSFYFAFGLVKPIAYVQDTYAEYNITVGRGFFEKGRFGFEGHVGIGYYENRERYNPDESVESFGSLGFPLRVKANFYLSKHFAIGLNPNANINFDSSIMTINLISQIKF